MSSLSATLREIPGTISTMEPEELDYPIASGIVGLVGAGLAVYGLREAVKKHRLLEGVVLGTVGTVVAARSGSLVLDMLTNHVNGIFTEYVEAPQSPNVVTAPTLGVRLRPDTL